MKIAHVEAGKPTADMSLEQAVAWVEENRITMYVQALRQLCEIIGAMEELAGVEADGLPLH